LVFRFTIHRIEAKLNEETTEEELLLLFLQGDSEAFTEVVHRYLPQVQAAFACWDSVKLCLVKRRMMRCSQPYRTAIELVRLRTLAVFIPDGKVESDGPHPAVTTRRQPDISLEELDKTENYDGYRANDIQDHALWPDEEMMVKEYWHAVDQQISEIDAAIAQLNPTEQISIRRSVFEGASASEIAKENSMSISKFYRVRNQAIAKLRKMLAATRNSAQ